jgi:hypothetical protein
MGDYLARWTGENRSPHIDLWEGTILLEWRPRLITVILVIVLVGLAAGISSWDFGDPSPMNWEW